MDLFSKCRRFKRRIDLARKLNQFFYLREIDPPATPKVKMRGDREMIMLGSNNYLGLSNHPKVKDAAIQAVKEYGTGACSSRILTGTTSLHNKLERKLAGFKGTEDAVVFSTGFMTMMGTITALTDEGDVILSDELNHGSIVDGCRLSRAEVKIYRHNDMKSLEEQLRLCRARANKLIVTDGVFSMKGSVANLPGIKSLARKYRAKIMVDDAHGTGTLGATGRGILEHFNMEGEIDLVCGTFSKTLSSTGGFTASTQEVVTFLKLQSRAFIFTASPIPAVPATILACLEVMEKEPQHLKNLRRNTDFMRSGLKQAGFNIEETITSIIPVLIGSDQKAFRMAGGLEKEGVFINPVIYPAVPKGSALIRVSIMASLTHKQLETALEKFTKVGKKVGIIK